MSQLPARITVMVAGHTPPGREFERFTGIRVGVQRGKADVVDPRSADAGGIRFEIPVDVVPARDGGLDFRGPFVHGRPGDRFLYLVWEGRENGGDYRGFRRAKLLLKTVPSDILTAALAGVGVVVARLSLSDDRGGPICAGVRERHLSWGLPEDTDR